MTPDEQPQPVAFQTLYRYGLIELQWPDSDGERDTNSDEWHGEPESITPLYAHPPISAASQPDVVRVTDELIERAQNAYADTMSIGESHYFPTVAGVRAALEATMSPIIDDAMVNRAHEAYLVRLTECGYSMRVETLEPMRAALESALNPPAESSARGDVPLGYQCRTHEEYDSAIASFERGEWRGPPPIRPKTAPPK